MTRDESLQRAGGVCALFNFVFDRQIPEEYFRWRYSAEPLLDIEATVLERDGQILFHYGSSVVDFNLGSATVRGAFAFAAMTHPAVRGQGLMQRLYTEHEEALRAKGCDFIFGFPNANADPVYFRHLDWRPIAEISTRSLDLSKLTRTSTRELVFDDAFEKFDYDAITDRAGLFASRRDTAFLRWRYTAHPLNEYRNLVIADRGSLRAYAVVKIYRPGTDAYLDLIDMHATDEREWRPLIETVCDFAAANGCRGVNVWAPRHHVIHLALSKLGFVTTAPVTYFSYKPFTARMPEQLRSWNEWWITMGDSDVY